jgi:superfamily II DNA or RNA helicase
LGKPTLEVLDSIHTKANKEARELILDALKYEEVYWKKGVFGGGKNVSNIKYLITGRSGTSGIFLTGLLPKVISYAREFGLSVRTKNEESIEYIQSTRVRPKLKGITFRSDQRKALRIAKKKQRGIIKFPTGSGKTIIALGLFSMYENSPRLFLCHTKDLLLQTAKEISLLPTKSELIVLGGGYKPEFSTITSLPNPIVISTIQTFSKYDPKKWSDYFDITIVDECHKASSLKSQYGQMMQFNLSPIKIGLSATPPYKGKKALVCEGFFGPVISDLSMEKGIRKGIIAKPEVKLLSVPYETSISGKCGNIYKLLYKDGIVKNKTRNMLIVNESITSLKKDEIVLIVVDAIEHGEILQEMFKKRKKDVPFVRGYTNKEEREIIKENLKKKKIPIAIATKVWREGVNIPSLNHVILAHGLKEEKMVIQAMGRGLRTAEGKSTIRLTDFLDPYKHLAQHSIMRIQVYVKQGWL